MAPLLPVLDYNIHFMHILLCPEQRIDSGWIQRNGCQPLRVFLYSGAVNPALRASSTQLKVTLPIEQCSKLHLHTNNHPKDTKGREAERSPSLVGLHSTLQVQLSQSVQDMHHSLDTRLLTANFKRELKIIVYTYSSPRG